MVANQRNPKKARGIVERFVAAIRGRIAEQDLSMVELSRRSGVARPYLYRVLDGKQTPSLDVAEKIAAAVGLEFSFAEKFSEKVA